MEDKTLLENRIFKKITQIIFGVERKSPLTISMFILHFIGSFIFLLWHSLSYFVIKNYNIIGEIKNISIRDLIERRGEELGYSYEIFTDNLVFFHFISLIIWLIINILGFLLYNNKKYVLLILFVLIIIYHSVMLSFFGLTYYKEDTTTFDKILMILIVINFVLFYFQSKSKEEESIFS